MRYRQASDGTLIAHEGNSKVVQLRPQLLNNNVACILHAYGTLTAYSYHGDMPTCAYEYERAANITRSLIDRTLGGELVMMGQFWFNATQETFLVSNLTIASVIDGVMTLSQNGLHKLHLPPGLNTHALARKVVHAYQERLTCTN